MENIDGVGVDSRLQFQAEVDGDYTVEIHDTDFGGLQHYVYRLTITSGVHLTGVYPLGGRRGQTVTVTPLGQKTPAQRVTALPQEGERRPFGLPGSGSLPWLLELSDAPEHYEEDRPRSIQLPATLNGQILDGEEEDAWEVRGVQRRLDRVRSPRRASWVAAGQSD